MKCPDRLRWNPGVCTRRLRKQRGGKEPCQVEMRTFSPWKLPCWRANHGGCGLYPPVSNNGCIRNEPTHRNARDTNTALMCPPQTEKSIDHLRDLSCSRVNDR